MTSSFPKTAKSDSFLIPGSFVVVHSVGILLLGKSGMGKSDCVLELTTRGHTFIADDCVRIKKNTPHRLMGMNPAKSRFPVHIRGLGVLDFEEIFGFNHVKKSHTIDLVIKLEKWQKKKLYLDLEIKKSIHEILGVKIPLLRLPVSSSRNIATLVEVAAKMV